jgi:prepilin-type N-terminal cleavage/methylation domain-containing protein
MKHYNSRRFRSGFTLLEMMLAIAILSIVLVMIAGSFRAVAHSKVHGENRLNTDREGRAILWQMSNEIKGAIQTPLVPSHVVLTGLGQMRAGIPVDSISISTLDAAHRRSIQGFGAEDIVSYEASPGAHRGWFVLSRSQGSALGGGGAGQSAVLADNVLALHIRYFNGQQWIESWDSASLPRGQQLPIAVAIDLALAAPGGRVMNYSTQVMVPMAVMQW